MLTRNQILHSLVAVTTSLVLFTVSTNAQETQLSEQLFPPELIMQNRAEIQLSNEQAQQIGKIVGVFGQKTSAAQAVAEKNSQELAQLLQAGSTEEAKANQLLKSFLSAEHEMKQSHFSAMLQVRNVLTAKQRTQLAAMRKTQQQNQAQQATAPRKPNETELRLRAKVDLIRKEIESRAARGVPSDEIGKLMQQFSADMQKGRVKEPESILDRALKTLNLTYQPQAQTPAVPKNGAMLPQPPAAIDRLKQTPKFTAAALKNAVSDLHVDDVAWRKIDWETSLIRGLKRSRAEHKPLVLWVFIDRPIDDERC